MKIKQRKQKIPFLISFLVLCGGGVLFGIFGPESQFSEDFPRSEPIIGGVIGTVTSTIWFFFGSIDWSTWNQIKKLVKPAQTKEAKQESEQ